MILTQQDINLLNCLKPQTERLKAMIAVGRPYVWELRLSADEFNDLETRLKDSIHSHGDDYHYLLSKDFALILVIYLAEWYKRCYKGAETMADNKVIRLNSKELQQLYDLAGIDTHTFVYNASKNPDKTSYRWLESLQVLGGLAIQAEIKKDEESDKLLPLLCKIFHGEDIDLSELKDRYRAVAFQESIQRKHSLYEYLDCILNKDKELPFSKADLADKNSLVNQLLDRILNADKKAKKDKFDFEWIVTYTARNNQMVRRLKVKLKPEAIGGQKRQYIGYDRLEDTWKVPHPEEIGRLLFALRFINGSHCVKEASFKDPLFKYHNTGSAATGFVSINKIDEAYCLDVPTSRFDKVQVVMKYDDTLRTVQTLEVKDYLQVYKLAKAHNEWSSRRNAQAATVVIFSSAYHLAEDYQDLPVVYAHYRNQDQESEDYCWCPINDKVVLEDANGKPLLPPFFNRNGLYQVVTKKYLETIKYQENLYVTYQWKELDEDGDEADAEVSTDTLPVLFGRDGLQVLHYPNGQANEGEVVSSNKYDLEWLQPNGRYMDWNEEQPRQGVVRLRVTVQGIVFKYKVFYVPFVPSADTPDPIWRDFQHTRICTALKGVNDIQDEFNKKLDKEEPDTKQLTVGTDQEKVLIDVYRPVLLKELSQKKPDSDGTIRNHVIEYYGADEKIEIPLINCDQFSVRDFSKKGVRTYRLTKRSTVYYGFPTFDDPNMAISNYSLFKKSAAELTPEIPLKDLFIYICKPEDQPHNLYAWNYHDEPEPVDSVDDMKDKGIVFQSLKDNPAPRHYASPKEIDVADDSDDSGEDWGDEDWGDTAEEEIHQEEDPMACFEMIAQHKVYYFLFQPFIDIVHDGDVIKRLLLPLMQKYQYHLPEYTVRELYRFAVEFHFDWMLISRKKWNEQIEGIIHDDEEKQKIEDAVIDFFRQTPKVTDEREQACLNEFLDRYWEFNAYPKVDDIAEKALRMILGDLDALHGQDMKDYLKEWDECRFKFIELSKAFKKS